MSRPRYFPSPSSTAWTYLSPEMKSTGEAIGYDDKLTRALYKALQSSGMNVANYGTIFVTIADKDKAEALPLIRRFYNLGFNIEGTSGTASTCGRMESDPYQGERYRGLPAPRPCQLCHQHPRARYAGRDEQRLQNTPLRLRTT